MKAQLYYSVRDYLEEKTGHTLLTPALAHALYLLDWRHLLDHGDVVSGIAWSFKNGRLERQALMAELRDLKKPTPMMLSRYALSDSAKQVLDHIIKASHLPSRPGTRFSEEALIHLAVSTYPAQVDASDLRGAMEEYLQMMERPTLRIA